MLSNQQQSAADELQPIKVKSQAAESWFFVKKPRFLRPIYTSFFLGLFQFKEEEKMYYEKFETSFVTNLFIEQTMQMTKRVADKQMALETFI